MHSMGIVDYDIHLGNLLVSLDGRLWKKADLGNAAFNQMRMHPPSSPFPGLPLCLLIPTITHYI